jgi:hypothetical protein
MMHLLIEPLVVTNKLASGRREPPDESAEEWVVPSEGLSGVG